LVAGEASPTLVAVAKGFAPSLPRPVLPEERYHVAPRTGAARAEQRIREEISTGTFRPPDADTAATLEEAYALFVPFWRVDIQRSDTSLKLTQVRIGTFGVPVPYQSGSEAKATWMVCARTAFPYEMKHPSTLLSGDARPLTVNLAALEHGDPSLRGGWEVLDADVDERQARELAAASLRRHAATPAALMTESEVTVHAIHFVRFPVWFARYRYRGEAAAADSDDLFYVGISAVDEAPITATHPSKLRAGAAKLRKLFRFEG
jgi:hypothetical protein